ncbi:AAA family ATPase [Bdellovibrionota bacterium FG-2]
MSFIYTTLVAHLRKRHILQELQKLAKFWPTLGIFGLRQSGKSTLLRELLGISTYLTLDDESTMEDAKLSAMNFLSKLPIPVIIDEVQKCPALFDAIKLKVDTKRKPGAYFLTGSSRFSAQNDIRESLTGRIGLIQLYPLTLAEAFQDPFEPERASPIHKKKPRYGVEQAFGRLAIGGLPVPLFTRDPANRGRYYRNWLETSILRDAAQVYGKGYDPDVSRSILRQIGQTLKEGELPTLSHFKQSARKLRRYLLALENIFLLQKLPCHESGVGSDAWIMSDSGLAA